jgi:hypothetical protein
LISHVVALLTTRREAGRRQACTIEASRKLQLERERDTQEENSSRETVGEASERDQADKSTN